MARDGGLYIPERRRVLVHGKVQGLGIRLWMRSVAETLALVGSCRLRPDGVLEADVQGNRTLVKQFVVACKRGPAGAEIDRVETETMAVDRALASFHVER